MHEKAIRRSADPAVTPTLLKSDAYHFADDNTQLMDRCIAHQVEAFYIDETTYHYKLHRCISKPTVLYRKGDISLLDSPLLAVVGPRKPSVYLQQIVEDLFVSASDYVLCTISGGAQGIDELAHLQSLKQSIPTIVVLGGGLRRYLQHQQRNFLEKVIEAGGLVISERKLDMEPTTYTFPQRNRLIAGLADVVFVPGASHDSGSLITVDYALQAHIPVVSVPGSIYEPSCSGTNRYIIDRKIQGTIDLSHFLSNYFTSKGQPSLFTQPTSLTDREVFLLGHIGEEASTMATLLARTGLEIGELMEVLMHLEIARVIYSPEPGLYARK